MFLKTLYTVSTQFLNDTKGNFAATTALLMFPATILVGMSVDLWNAYEAKTKMDQVADSAALAAINTQSRVYINQTNGMDKSNWDREAQAFFEGNKAAVAPHLDVAVSADVQRKDLTISSLVRYRMRFPTTFMTMIGVNELEISGEAEAEFNVGEFYNVNVLVDNSPSMGIGASQADVDKMQARIGCAFACHDLSNTMNNLPKVGTLGVKLRIDVVSNALIKLADMVSNSVAQKGLYKLALYSLGARADNAVATPLSMLQAMTQDMDAFRQSARSVQLMIMPKYNYNAYAVGYINKSIQLLNQQIPASGTGTGVNSPRQVLLLVTDGVVDMQSTASSCYGVFQYGRCTQPVDVNECQRLKNRGVLVAVLHTTYLPITTNDNYVNWVRPFADRIGPALQSCASPNLYEHVDMNSDISASLNELFKRATNMPRLTM